MLDEGETQLSQGRELLAQKQAEVNAQLQRARALLDEEQANLENAQADLNAQEEALSGPFGPAWPNDLWEAWLAAPPEAETEAQSAFMAAFMPD